MDPYRTRGSRPATSALNTSCRHGWQQAEHTTKIGQVIEHGMKCGPHLVFEVILDVRNRSAKVSADDASGVFQISKVLGQYFL